MLATRTGASRRRFSVTSAQSDIAPGSGQILSAGRAIVCVAFGLAAGAVVALFGLPALVPLVVWTVASATALIWVWRISWPQDPAGTERLAEEESRSRSTDTGVLLATVASLVAIAVALVQSSSRNDTGAVAAVLLSVVSVVLSWALVNTVFVLKYARLYYVDEPDAGGIDFKQHQPPAYSDFAYLAFTVGMTFGTTETEPTQTRIRRVVLGHALMSFLFGTGVIAVAVNLVTNLGQS
jgi:uncharacterized membrane protein